MPNNTELTLAGHSTDHIWLMEDGPDSHPIGVRMDCGDSGTVYMSKAQAKDLAEQLLNFASEDEEDDYIVKTVGCSHQYAFSNFRKAMDHAAEFVHEESAIYRRICVRKAETV